MCVFVRIQKLPRLLVASSDGYFYIYNVDPQDGGECVLVQKHRCVCVCVRLLMACIMQKCLLVSNLHVPLKENSLHIVSEAAIKWKWKTNKITDWVSVNSVLGVVIYSFFLLCSYRLFDLGEDPMEQREEEKQEDVFPQPANQSYAATVALPSTPPSSTTLMGMFLLHRRQWKPFFFLYY